MAATVPRATRAPLHHGRVRTADDRMQTSQHSPPISFSNLPSKISDEWLSVKFQSAHADNDDDSGLPDEEAQCGPFGSIAMPFPDKSYNYRRPEEPEHSAAQSLYPESISNESGAIFPDSGCCDCSQHLVPAFEENCDRHCGGHEYHQVLDDDVSSIVSCTSSCTPLAVRHYFQLSRDALVAWERLDDFDFQQETSLRTVASSRSAAAATSERRQRLYDLWYSKQCEVDGQKQECLLSGLNPERFRYRRRSRVFDSKDVDVVETTMASEVTCDSIEDSRVASIEQWLEQSADYVLL